METPDFMDEKVHDIFAIDMDIDIAIRVIQNNERGRQGIARIHQIKKIIRDQKKEKDMQKMIKRGGGRMQEGQQAKEQKATENTQRRIRGILARKQVQAMREEEMVFLGMQRPQKRAQTAAPEMSGRRQVNIDDPLSVRNNQM